jgi:hypothetical protein
MSRRRRAAVTASDTSSQARTCPPKQVNAGRSRGSDHPVLWRSAPRGHLRHFDSVLSAYPDVDILLSQFGQGAEEVVGSPRRSRTCT